jgi:putative DNA primase/helicase
MRPITVSFGKGDKAAITAVKVMPWEQFAAALTAEPPESDDKASRGWYIPASFNPVYRHGDNFVSRDAITLDLDQPTIDTWGNTITALADVPFAMYTTFSHTYDAPRFRVVIPLSRPTGFDEYQAVVRKVSEKIGIEYVARESFVAPQMMYLPLRKLGGAFESYIGKGKQQ